MRKWNYNIQDYEPYTISSTWHCPAYSDNMDETINCASCGCKMLYGDGYTSRVIHGDRSGFGYVVCSDCHDVEIIAENNWRKSMEDAANE